ncbi:MAG: aldo/keto reductase, partial [Phycisphaerae bacterium]|nr:aldo/keto reductase [Phycisphaerae bacterium]
SEQPPYSIFARGIEKEVLPACKKYGLAVIPWSPLAGGWLSGKYRKNKPIPEGSRFLRRKKNMDVNSPDNARRFDAIEALVPLADEVGLTLAEFALAWVKSNPLVTAPLLGPRTIEHLHSYLNVLDVKLPAEIIKKVDDIVPSGTDLFIL